MARGRSWVLVALLLVAGFATWRLMRPTRTEIQSDEWAAPGDGARAPTAAPVPLAAGAPKPAPQPATPATKDAGPATPVSGPRTVRVTVSAPGGVADGTVVHVWRRSGSGSVDRTFTVARDGTVDVELAEDLAAGKAMGSLVVAVPGRPLVQVPLDPALLESGRASVEVPKGAPLSGRVVDRDGRPVARLPVVATTAETNAYAVYDEYVDVVAALRRNRWIDVVHGTTDEDGRFELAVMPWTGYSIATDADGWIFQMSERHHPTPAGIVGIVATAVPAVTLRSRVTDAGSGDGIANSFWKIERRGEANAFAFSWTFAGPDLRVTWRRDADLGAAVDFDAHVSATVYGPPDATGAGPSIAYAPQAVDLRFLAGETSIRRDVQLARAAALGEATVTYEFTDPDGQPVDLPVYLDVRTASGDGGAIAFAGLAKVDSGRYVGKVAPGDWTLAVRVRQPLQKMVTTEDRVTLAPGEARTIRARFPKTGRLSVTWPWTRVQNGWIVELRDASGSPTFLESTPQEGSLAFAAVPVGHWRVRVAPAGDDKHSLARDVEITAGASSTVDFPR